MKAGGLATEIQRVPGVRGANAYLMTSPEGIALIDTGFPGNLRPVLRLLTSLGRKPSDLRYILLTHGHPDHTGSAKALRQATGAHVLIHEGDVHSLVGNLALVRCHGVPSMIMPAPWRADVDGCLREGDTIAGLRVLYTPGSVCLWREDDGILFTGDLITQRGRYVSRSMPFPGTDLRTYHESILRVSELPAQIACLGHGGPLLEDVPRVLRETGLWYAGSPRTRRWLQNLPGPLRPGLHPGYLYR